MSLVMRADLAFTVCITDIYRAEKCTSQGAADGIYLQFASLLFFAVLFFGLFFGHSVSPLVLLLCFDPVNLAVFFDNFFGHQIGFFSPRRRKKEWPAGRRCLVANLSNADLWDVADAVLSQWPQGTAQGFVWNYHLGGTRVPDCMPTSGKG